MKSGVNMIEHRSARPRMAASDLPQLEEVSLRDHLRAAVAEITALRRALAHSQTVMRAYRDRLDELEDRDALLTQEVKRLRQNEAAAWTLAYYDELTGLPNRRLLRDRLTQAIAQSTRQHTEVALLFLDLDGFKSVNDQLGHAAGDQLLRLVAERLSTSVRAADTAARYGGDEFIIMLHGVDQPTPSAMAAKLAARLSEPYVIDRCRVQIGASIGTARFPDDGRDPDELLRKADAALYRVKSHSSKATISALPVETAVTHGSRTSARAPSQPRR